MCKKKLRRMNIKLQGNQSKSCWIHFLGNIIKKDKCSKLDVKSRIEWVKKSQKPGHRNQSVPWSKCKKCKNYLTWMWKWTVDKKEKWQIVAFKTFCCKRLMKVKQVDTNKELQIMYMTRQLHGTAKKKINK